MASPTERNLTIFSSTTTAATAHSHNTQGATVPLVANELIVIAVRWTVAPGTVGFSGYTMTRLVTDSSDASTGTTEIYYRYCNGSETASNITNWTTVNAVKMASMTFRITGAADPATQAPEFSTVAIGTTTANTANPGSRAVTGGPKDVLYLAIAGGDGETSTYTAVPTNYANLLFPNSGTGGAVTTNGTMGGATRAISSSSSDDPGVFTHGAHSTGWTAYTVVVHPASSGTTYTKAGYGRESL